jgi:hypothetical protein
MKTEKIILYILIMILSIFSIFIINQFIKSNKIENKLESIIKKEKILNKYKKISCSYKKCKIKEAEIIFNKNKIISINEIIIQNPESLNNIKTINTKISFKDIKVNNEYISKPFIDELKYKISQKYNVSKMLKVVNFIKPRYKKLNININLKNENNKLNIKANINFNKEFLKLESDIIIKDSFYNMKKPKKIKNKLEILKYNESLLKNLIPLNLKIILDSKNKDFILNLYKLSFEVERDYFNEEEFKIETDLNRKGFYEFINIDLVKLYDKDMKKHLEKTVDNIFYGKSSKIEIKLINSEKIDLTRLIKIFYKLIKKEPEGFIRYIKITH